MAGVDTKTPGFTHILLHPQPDLRRDDELPEGQTRITHVNAAFDAPTGRIETSWSTEEGDLRFYATVPVARNIASAALRKGKLYDKRRRKNSGGRSGWLCGDRA